MKFFYTTCVCFALVASISAVAIGVGNIGLGGWPGNRGGLIGHGAVLAPAVRVPIAAYPSRAVADAAAGANSAGLRHNDYAAAAVVNYQIDGGHLGSHGSPIVSAGHIGKLNPWASSGIVSSGIVNPGVVYG